MLKPPHYREMAEALRNGATKPEIKLIANKIRLELNPHPAGQMEQNMPIIDEVKLTDVQHKYRETMLFFPENFYLDGEPRLSGFESLYPQS